MAKNSPEFGETTTEHSLPLPVEGRKKWNCKSYGKALAGTAIVAACAVGGASLGLYIGLGLAGFREGMQVNIDVNTAADGAKLFAASTTMVAGEMVGGLYVGRKILRAVRLI